MKEGKYAWDMRNTYEAQFTLQYK